MSIDTVAKTSLFDLFSAQAASVPDRPALIYGDPIHEDGQTSYADLLQRVQKLALFLEASNVKPGDRIALLSHNSPFYVEMLLAAGAIGAIVACLNWRLSGPELHHCVELVDPTLLISQPELASVLSTAVDRPVLLIDAALDKKIAACDSADFHPHPIDPESGLVILYTSGTTGLPKGAVISHRAMIARAQVFGSEFNIPADRHFIAWAPFFHMVSTDQGLATLLRGGAVIVIDGYDVQAILTALKHYQIGWLVLIPGMIEGFTAALEGALARPSFQLAGVTACGAMADLVPPHQLAAVTKLLNAPYRNTFGATETGIPPASRGIIAPGVVPQSLSKIQSSFCEIRLENANGETATLEEPGELLIRGPTVFSGYWNAPAVNEEAFSGGWFHMGDVFKRHADGTLDFVDRAKYLIKTGGENVYPAEIERILLSDPGVLEAGVVKAPDPKWGETPVAFVAREDSNVTEARLRKLCDQSLARYKHPRDIHFIGFSEFPRSTSGKVQRHLLEARLTEAE